MDVKGRGNHFVAVSWLTGFATYPAVLDLEFPCRLANTPPSKQRAAGCSAPELELSRLGEIQREEWPGEIGEPAIFFFFLRFFKLLVRNRLSAQNHGNHFLFVYRRLISKRVLE